MKHLIFFGIAFAAFHISQSVEEFCNDPVDVGTGKSFIFSLYYDHTKDQCTPFFYTGEGGNDNRFINERECMRNCSPNAQNLYPFDVHEACHFKKAEGGCSGRYLRYYYDSQYDKCKKFLWTGCFGNGNRFTDMGTCNNTCAGIHDDGEDPEEDEPDTPIAIICGILLGVILVAVIITVVLLTVKSQGKKSPKDSTAGNGKKMKKLRKDKQEEAKSEDRLPEERMEVA